MESLLLSCGALASPTMCRFIPALSVPETRQPSAGRTPLTTCSAASCRPSHRIPRRNRGTDHVGRDAHQLVRLNPVAAQRAG